MIKSVRIVLGTFFGDEGKGSTVQWLANEKSLVVRFSGGPQCGHRVIYNGIEHICSLVGSGVLKGATTYLHKDVYIDPISLYNEIMALKEKGIHPKIYIHPDCRVITPYDIVHDICDARVLKHGTCGCGIHATFVRSKKYPITFKKAMANPWVVLNDFSNRQVVLDAEFVNKCIALSDLVHIEKDVYLNYEDIILEGSQGLLLDMDNGFMPHCTPSRVGLNGVPEELLEDAEVYLVMRSYLTRHGNGFNPVGEDFIRKYYNNLEEPTNLDTGYQGKFKIGMFSDRLLRDAYSRSHLDNYARMYNVKYNAVVTHMDCNPGQDSIPTLEYGFMHLGELFTSDVISVNNIYIGLGPNSDIIMFEP